MTIKVCIVTIVRVLRVLCSPDSTPVRNIDASIDPIVWLLWMIVDISKNNIFSADDRYLAIIFATLTHFSRFTILSQTITQFYGLRASHWSLYGTIAAIDSR